jgi:hypothetical protein
MAQGSYAQHRQAINVLQATPGWIPSGIGFIAPPKKGLNSKTPLKSTKIVVN